MTEVLLEASVTGWHARSRVGPKNPSQSLGKIDVIGAKLELH